MKKKVCLIAGVGPGTGMECASRFSKGGYKVAMLARDQERLNSLEEKIDDAHGYQCDVSDLDQLVSTLKNVTNDLGAPTVLIHNAVAGNIDGGGASRFMESDPARLERNFRVNTTSLLYMARELAPAMIDAGEGAIIVTGNTSSTRGSANFAYFAPTKAAQRILAEAMARDLSSSGRKALKRVLSIAFI